jgi:heme exporter protein C
MSFWEFANPKSFMDWTARVLPWVTGLAVAALVAGLAWGLFLTPDAELFGASVKILYVHVPSAMMAVNVWIMMLVASLIWLVRRHHVSVLAARAAAPVGAVMTVIAIATGALWGSTAWGSWWEFDARLTSFLVLFLFYIGYIALWSAIDSPDRAADLTSILCLVGSVFAILSRYAAFFWAQGMHQGASLSLDAEENVADVYWVPLVVAIAGFILLFVALVLARTRTEIRRRRLSALEARERLA